jgi:hypothetical protein
MPSVSPLVFLCIYKLSDNQITSQTKQSPINFGKLPRSGLYVSLNVRCLDAVRIPDSMRGNAQEPVRIDPIGSQVLAECCISVRQSRHLKIIGDVRRLNRPSSRFP